MAVVRLAKKSNYSYFIFMVLHIATLIGCSRDPLQKSSQLKITLPATTNKPIISQSVSSQSAGNWGQPDPTTIAQVNCYAVAVSGPENSMQTYTCTDTSNNVVMRPGVIVGAVQAGLDVIVDVPSGADRDIYLIGFVAASSSACSDFEVSGGPDHANLSHPHILAQTRRSLDPGTVQVELTASLSGAIKFNHCDKFGAEPSGPPPPSLLISDAMTTEGGSLLFVASLSSVASEDVVFSFATSPGTATAGSDYAANSGVITIPAGSTIATIAVATTDDSLAEGGSEHVYLNLTALSAHSVPDPMGLGIINDNDVANLFVADASATEGSNIDFVITLNIPTSLPVVFLSQNYNGNAGMADYSGQYTPIANTLAAGQTSFTISTNTTADLTYETNEVFTLTLTPISGVSSGGDETAIGTINNDDALPMVYIGDATTAIEGANFVFTVSLSNPYYINAVITYTTMNGTATGSSIDFTDSSGTITLSSGSTQTAITVTSINDSLDENSEAFSVSLVSIGGLAAADILATATMNDDDAPPTLMVADATYNEGDALLFIVSITTISALDVVFDAQTSDNTASSPGDFTALVLSTHTIPAGSLQAVIMVNSTEDATPEVPASENFNFDISNIVNASGGDVSGVGTIVDDDSGLAISNGPTFDYGTQPVGITIAHTFTISNTGSSNLSSLSVNGFVAPFSFKGGSYPGVGGDCSTSLNVSTSCLIVIDYAPAGAGVHSDGIDVTFYDGVVTSTVTAGIQGTGAAPASLSISDGPTYDFGTQANGSNTDFTFVITNSGGVAATALSGTGLAAPYSFKGGSYPGTGGTCGVSLGAAAGCSIVVTYSPTTVAVHNDTMDINYNNGVTGQVASRDVTGTGANPAVLSISDGPTYDYGTNPTGSNSDKTFTINNTGGVAATALSGNGLAAPYSFKGGSYPGVGGTCGASLSAAASCTVVVTYSPTTVTVHNDTMDINYNDGASGQTASRNVTGTGANPAVLSISDGPTYDYGYKVVGSVTTKTFTVTNSGDVTATSMSDSGLAAPYSFNGGSYPGTSGTCSTTLAASSNCTIVVEYAPVSTGAHNDTVEINYNDGVIGQMASRDITANGVEPILFIQDAGVVSEGTAFANFNITLDTPPIGNVVFSFSVVGNQALSGVDFVAAGGLLTIGSGQISLTTSISIINDSLYENGFESFFVSISGYSYIGDNLGLASISDNDAMPYIVLGDITVSENTSANVIVSLSSVSGVNATFNWQTVNETAIAPGDFTLVGPTAATIPPGSSQITLTVSIVDDFTDEGTEYFKVSLSSLGDVSVSGPPGLLAYISDNDSPPSLYISSASFSEAQSALVTVSLSAPSGQFVSFFYSTHDGTAIGAGAQDFQNNSGFLSIPIGSTSILIGISITNDNIYEFAEYFTVSLSSISNAMGMVSIASITINSDEPVPAAFIGDAGSISEGGSALFVVSIDYPSAYIISMSYSTYSGTAFSGSDFSSASGIISLVAGQASTTIPVFTINDMIDEPSQNFVVSLTGYTIVADDTATATILDDDSAPFIKLLSAMISEGDTLSFSVSLSTPTEFDIDFNVQSLNQTAVAPSDYTSLNINLTVLSGVTTLAIPVITTEDSLYEGSSEIMQLTLSAINNATLQFPSDGFATGTIFDDDAMPMIYFHNAATTEGQTADLLVTLSSPSGLNVEVNWATMDGSATTGDSDYTSSSGRLTIPAGSLSFIQPFTTTNDPTVESDEYFNVTFSSLTNASFGGSTSANISIMNNDVVSLLYIGDTSNNEGSSLIFTVSISATQGSNVTFDYNLANGTADTNFDLSSTIVSGSGTIPSGQYYVWITIGTFDDLNDEPNETFFVSLSNFSISPGDTSALGTILDNDSPPTLIVNQLQHFNEGYPSNIFNVSLSAFSGFEIAVTISFQNGTANYSTDHYESAARVLTIPSGFATGWLSIAINNDTVAENDEQFTASIASYSNLSSAPTAAITLLIHDDDPMFIWQKGIENNVNSSAVYGTISVGSPSNTPGARIGFTNWTDNAGNLWLFGGQMSGGALKNDMWMYSPSTGNWTWFTGAQTTSSGIYGTMSVASSTVTPGARKDATGWVDGNGDLYLFGGDGYDYDISNDCTGALLYLDDLWKFNVSTKQWIWLGPNASSNMCGNVALGSLSVANSGNSPGGRYSAQSVFVPDLNKVYLFGGYGHGFSGDGLYSDIWTFNPSTGNWTWVSGPSIPDQDPVAGAAGVSATSYHPGGVQYGVLDVDSSNNIWFFGGYGRGSSNQGERSSVWRYTTANNQWAFMHGASGAHNTINTYSDTNTSSAIPGARSKTRGFIDNNDQFWIIGGFGNGNSASQGQLNDVWTLDLPSATMTSPSPWKPLKGNTSTINQVSTPGTQGIGADANIISGRKDFGLFKSVGGVWIYGGYGYHTSPVNGHLEDLWQIVNIPLGPMGP